MGQWHPRAARSPTSTWTCLTLRSCRGIRSPGAPLSGYVRVSKVGGREGEGFISPDVQEKAIRDWAKRTGVGVVVEPHELNVSGGTMDRPVFNSIMEKIRTGKSEGIVVYKLDRFARSLLGAITTLAELGAHDAVLASATEPELDYTTPAGRAFMQQMFVFAEFVREERSRSPGRRRRVTPSSSAGSISRRPTTSATTEATTGGLCRTSKHLWSSRSSVAGGPGSWARLADYLNEAAPRPDGRDWTSQAAQRICDKRVYRGEASRYVDQDVDGRGRDGQSRRPPRPRHRARMAGGADEAPNLHPLEIPASRSRCSRA